MLSELAELDLLARAYEFRWAIALAGLGVYVLRKLRGYWRLRHFKGPFGTGFFGLWHTRALLSWKSHVKYREVTDTYGARASTLDLIYICAASCLLTVFLNRAPR